MRNRIVTETWKNKNGRTYIMLALIGFILLVNRAHSQDDTPIRRLTVKDIPLTATQWITRTVVGGEGSPVTTTQQVDIARSSKGEIRREIHESTSGTARVRDKDSILVSISGEDRHNVNARANSTHAVTSVKFPEPNNTNIVSGKNLKSTSAKTDSELAQLTVTNLGTSELEGFRIVGRQTKRMISSKDKNGKSSYITSETWYSPDLHMVLKSSIIDGENGQETMVMTNIKRSEPDPSLF